jgi:TRAP-type C4-dicarboxylate transport system permease small subunit
MYVIAGIAIILMMMITCADVVLRYLRLPIPGTYELVCFLGAVAVSFAMARTTRIKGHVAVSLVVRLLNRRLQIIIEWITTFLALILFGVLSWQTFLFAGDLRATKEVSLTLELPFYHFVYGLSFAAGAVCLVLLAELIQHTEKVFKK